MKCSRYIQALLQSTTGSKKHAAGYIAYTVKWLHSTTEALNILWCKKYRKLHQFAYFVFKNLISQQVFTFFMKMLFKSIFAPMV